MATTRTANTTGKGKADTEAHRFKWKLFVGGLASIIVGYVLLGAADITISPILLVLGYCILVPLSFL